MKVTALCYYMCSCGKHRYPHEIAKEVRFEDGKEHKKTEIKRYYRIDTKYCCEEMKKAIEHDFIIFGKFEGYDYSDKEVNIIGASTCCYEGMIFDTMPIRLCPWCGEKIEVEIKEEEMMKNENKNL